MKNRRHLTREKRNLRNIKKSILICVEGEKTEIQYFDLLRQCLRSTNTSIHFKTVKPKGTDPLSILRGCIKFKDKHNDKYDSFFCVIDVDEHANLEQALQEARKQNIFMVVTNIKFEVWLLWHIDSSLNHHMPNHEINRRVKEISSKHPFMVGQNNKELNMRFPVDRYKLASVAARESDPDMSFNRKGPNPSSALPLLIDKIING